MDRMKIILLITMFLLINSIAYNIYQRQLYQALTLICFQSNNISKLSNKYIKKNYYSIIKNYVENYRNDKDD